MSHPDSTQSDKCLILVTRKFPFGHQETFLENEVEVLGQNFPKVIIVPLRIQNETKQRPLPENFEVVIPPNRFEHTQKPNGMANWLGCIWDTLTYTVQELKKGSLRKKLLERNTSKVSFLKVNGVRTIFPFFNRLNQAIRNEYSSIVYYSYWLDSWVLDLIKLKKSSNRISVHSRVHGYDLYHERSSNGYLPFRPYMLSHCDGIHPVSCAGRDYLANWYDDPNSIISVQYLGVSTPEVLSSPSDHHPFRLVTAANLIPLKRVSLLIKALSYCDISVRLDVFGDGPEEQTLREMALAQDKHSIIFHGRVTNTALLEWYQREPVDLFTLVSESEGLPVSIMEALSYGIPVLATNVGGISEAVSKKNGLLVPKDISPVALGNSIQGFLKRYSRSNEKIRQEARSTFESKFDAARNYLEFSHHLNIHNDNPYS